MTRKVALVMFVVGLVMAETSLWSDDFEYASQAEFEDAYPYDFDNTVTGVVSNVDLVTPGPTGYATGVDSKVPADNDYAGLFSVNEWLISPTSRCFHVRGVWQIDASDGTNPTGTLMKLGWLADDGSDFFGTYLALSVRLSDPTELLLTVFGGTPYPTPSYTSGYVPGTLTPNEANKIDVSGEISSLSETSPGSGVYAPNADGSVLVTVNDVTFVALTNIVVWSYKADVPTPKWNQVDIYPAGTFSGLRVWECGTEVVIVDSSDPCCATGKGVPPGGGTGNGPPPFLTPEIGTQISCAGGGQVPTQPDIVFAENWWGA